MVVSRFWDVGEVVVCVSERVRLGTDGGDLEWCFSEVWGREDAHVMTQDREDGRFEIQWQWTWHT